MPKIYKKINGEFIEIAKKDSNKLYSFGKVPSGVGYIEYTDEEEIERTAEEVDYANRPADTPPIDLLKEINDLKLRLDALEKKMRA